MLLFAIPLAPIAFLFAVLALRRMTGPAAAGVVFAWVCVALWRWSAIENDGGLFDVGMRLGLNEDTAGVLAECVLLPALLVVVLERLWRRKPAPAPTP